MGKRLKAALDSAIEEIVRAEFADAIDSVMVTEDRDADGDPILRVMVVFRSKSSPNLKKATGLVRHILPVLEDKGADAFPIVSFRSKADHDRLSVAA